MMNKHESVELKFIIKYKFKSHRFVAGGLKIIGSQYERGFNLNAKLFIRWKFIILSWKLNPDFSKWHSFNLHDYPSNYGFVFEKTNKKNRKIIFPNCSKCISVSLTTSRSKLNKISLWSFLVYRIISQVSLLTRLPSVFTHIDWPHFDFNFHLNTGSIFSSSSSCV